MITHFLRLAMAHTLKPFLFTKVDPESEAGRLEDAFLNGNYGLYIHVPFCESLCDFCPYNKEVYSRVRMDSFIKALLIEIEMYSDRISGMGNPESLYFGGGSPALAVEYLPAVLESVEKNYGRPRKIGIELHPQDAVDKTLDMLKDLGVSMVSLGIQSFSNESRKAIGRGYSDTEAVFRAVKSRGFDVVDVDLIFAFPGQTEDSLEDDFRRAVEAGATQVSTYPFIRFSCAGRRYPAPDRKVQRQLLEKLAKTAESLGYIRTSVWTFAKPAGGRYSSVTRNNFLGFGPSATSLFRERFTLNTFSVDEYCRSLDERVSPRALELKFSRRVRRMYWLFWSCYNLHLSEKKFKEFFGAALMEEFGGALKFASILKLVVPVGDGFILTARGALWFHRVEQVYTHQYIDKTWRICGSEARPAKIGLF